MGDTNCGASFIVECAEASLGTQFDLKGIQAAYLKQSTENVPKNGRADIDNYMTDGYVYQDNYEEYQKSYGLTLSAIVS